MPRSPQLKIAHLYQESNIRFCLPQAAQVHIYYTIRGLQRVGHEVTLLALQRRRVLCTTDLQVFERDELPASYYAQLGVSGNAFFQRFESGTRRIQSELHLPYFSMFDSYRMAEASYKNLQGFSLIHERFNLLALGGTWASRKLGIPYVLEVNADLLEQRKFKGNPERGLRHLFALWATRISFNYAARIICISTSLKDHLRNKWNVEEDKLAVLPCAADAEAFKPRRNPEIVRRDLGLNDEPVLIWVGGFYPWHDLGLLLESFAQVLEKCPNAKLVLVGDGQTRPAIASTVVKNGLQNSVIFTGQIDHTKVPELMSIADVAVVPSAPIPANRGGTGTPLKLFEYMAAGKAIVTTAYDQSAEVIQHDHNGLLVEAGNVDGFAGAILSLLNDAEERDRLGRNARQQAIKHYSWEQYTKQLEEIYLSVL
jgi:glycosyltransferase involved in cell wall biosynthesis